MSPLKVGIVKVDLHTSNDTDVAETKTVTNSVQHVVYSREEIRKCQTILMHNSRNH